MAKITVRSREDAPVEATDWDTTGDVGTLAYLQGDNDPIHLHLHTLSAGAQITLEGRPSDLSVYVWSGSVDAGGVALEAGSSAVVEFGASQTFAAGGDGAELLVFNRQEHDAEAPTGRNIHLLPADRVPKTDAFYGSDGIAGGLHADAQCPTCQVWLHEQGYRDGKKETGLHSHSEDEVIFVTWGSIQLGRKIYGPGTALAIHANAKYAFWSGPEGLGFVNFRGSSPTYTSADGSRVLDEAELWVNALGHPQYLAPAA